MCKLCAAVARQHGASVPSVARGMQLIPGCNRAATGLQQGCNRAATGLQQGCNKIATELRQCCNRTATGLH